jgi:hypothetical protein
MSNPTGGPKTEAGKEVARWNATRHGIRSPAPVIPGLEIGTTTEMECWRASRPRDTWSWCWQSG